MEYQILACHVVDPKNVYPTYRFAVHLDTSQQNDEGQPDQDWVHTFDFGTQPPLPHDEGAPPLTRQALLAALTEAVGAVWHSRGIHPDQEMVAVNIDQLLLAKETS